MPCRSDDMEAHFQNRKDMKAELDDVTRMLCAVMAQLELDMNHARGDNDPKFRDPPITKNVPGLRKWWDKHKDLDRRRREKEKEEALKEARRKTGLAKLTPGEREALGLKE